MDSLACLRPNAYSGKIAQATLVWKTVFIRPTDHELPLSSPHHHHLFVAAGGAWRAAEEAGGAEHRFATRASTKARTVFRRRASDPRATLRCLSWRREAKRGLRLDSREGALAGGGSYGPAIVPGKSQESPLLLFSAHLEPGMEMPPEEDMLPEGALATLRAWIDQGAVWPKGKHDLDGEEASLGNQAAFFKKAATHWAFQPIKKADASSLIEGSKTIDSLVIVPRREKGLSASPKADAVTLLKRLHFDTTGLPPTPAESKIFIAAFEQDPEAALQQKVDELLASPNFGERWGRYWLDLARYADTQDFLAQADLRYPFAWTYRDYVIGAFNSDKPYDAFIREQLAADQLELPENDPALAALGFLTVGPRFRNRVDEIMNDRIDVVTRGLMGMTVACARCHDHKYDPIPTADFYALYGVFASTDIPDTLPEIRLAQSNHDAQSRADYEAEKAKAEKALQDFIQDLKDKAVADILAKPVLYFDALVQMKVTKTADVRKLISDKQMIETALTPLERRWDEMRGAQKWWKDPFIGPLARVSSASPDRKAEVLESIITKKSVPGGAAHLHPMLQAALEQEAPKTEAELVRVYGDILKQAIDHPDETSKQLTHSLTASGGWLDFPLKDVESAHRLLGTGRRDLNKLETAIAEVEATHPGAPPRAMAVRDKAKPITPTIFIRGDSSRRGDEVQRRFLSVLDPSKQPFSQQASGRLDLANHITSPENPLTSRVWANQIWRHLIGKPLVKSTGDFGLQAEPPTHPELLDWMASALLQRGWSTKKLIRDVLLSDTYQQSSDEHEEGAKLDADNNLLWRANRRRMDFESMRDAMLAASGQLDSTMGGRAVSLSAEPFTGRRTIYGHVDRVNLDPLFTTFDFPSPDIASTERTQTLVPQQALFALNDGFIISQARALAALATNKADSDSPGTAIDWLYQRVYLRSPHADERELALRFLTETTQISGEARRGDWAYGYGSADPTVKRKDAFTRLPYYDAGTKRYQGSREYPSPKTGFASLTATGGHPGASIEMASIRRWIAPADGEYSVRGELLVNRQNKGDGVRGRVISSRQGLVGEWIADGATVATTIETLSLRAGEVLDFAVDCRESSTSDGYRWGPTITQRIRPEDSTVGQITQWDASSDFAPPPPPKLKPLEQFAQALLMTNEFLFVD